MMNKIIVIFLIIIEMCSGLQNITLVIAPSVVQRGKHVSLLCEYDLEGAPLYSVKWYRGRYEFYRYSPSETPSTKVFPYPGIAVDESMSNASQVRLRDVSLNLSGNISCEVTTDAPAFSTAVAVQHMVVVDLPRNGPKIFTNKSKYEPGDRLVANCSSSPSHPFAMLLFYINDLQVSKEGDTQVSPGPDSLSWSLITIDKTLYPSHFDDAQGILRLSCTAVIKALYRNTTHLQIPYRKDPIPERVTSRSIASQTSSSILKIRSLIFLFLITCNTIQIFVKI